MVGNNNPLLPITGIPETTPFSLPGDSGSFIVSADKNSRNNSYGVKALLFAGGRGDDWIDHTIASPIGRIADDFEVYIVNLYPSTENSLQGVIADADYIDLNNSIIALAIKHAKDKNALQADIANIMNLHAKSKGRDGLRRTPRWTFQCT